MHDPGAGAACPQRMMDLAAVRVPLGAFRLITQA